MCSENCGITINGISNNERWRRERKKNRLSKRTEQNNTQREETTTKKMRKERSAFINPDCCCCSSYNWLMLLYTFYLFFSFFSIPGWFAIYSKDSCSTFQNDSNNTNRLDVDFVDFALTAVVVVFSKIRKKTSSRSSFRFELGITSYVRFLWFWILKDGFPRDLESNLYWKTEKTTNDFSP